MRMKGAHCECCCNCLCLVDTFLELICRNTVCNNSCSRSDKYLITLFVCNPYGYTCIKIPCEIYNDNIFEIAERIAKDYPCYMCAKMRRGSLYTKASSLGCNKLALGHHFDDVIETTLMSMFYMGKFETMLPRLKSDNFDIELIRPLFYVEEKDIIKWVKNNGISPMNCGCTVAAGKTSSKRRETKELITQLVKNNPDIKKRIIQSTQNVNLEKILGWKTSGGRFSYLNNLEK